MIDLNKIRKKTTYLGRVVYDRKKNIFRGKDMTRVVIAVHNNNTADIVAWRAVMKIAQKNFELLLERERKEAERKETAFPESYYRFVDLVDKIFYWSKILLDWVPGAGYWLDQAVSLWELAIGLGLIETREK